MSVRAVVGKLWKHGKFLLHHKGIYVRNISQCIKTVNQVTPRTQRNNILNTNRRNVLRQICVEVSQQARRILIDDAINRLSNKFSSELFQNVRKRGLYGNSILLGFIGVTVISDRQSILSKDEELEGILWDIRECISRIQCNREYTSQKALNNKVTNLNSLVFGKPIAKGSSAVVYSVANTSDASNFDDTHNIKNYPLALKMMFNYDIQSNSLAILKAMHREVVPAESFYNNFDNLNNEYDFLKVRSYLPPHPNIVQILSVFSDFIPELEECRFLYPAALPKRIDPMGEGRNMSLFILMKRYNLNLHEYLRSSMISTRTSVLLLTQLLEGIVHMVKNNIAHRDLKADNILLNISSSECPLLVITDFGCCSKLLVPYTTYDTDKGGNIALMAPEIINKRPRPFVKLNYLKSDLWAAGTLAYEIFGQANPFYGAKNKKLFSSNYNDEDLPNLPENVPMIIRNLIYNILSKDPRKRLDSEIATNICQLYFWAPNSWLDGTLNGKIPKLEDILDWLLSLSVKLLCESPGIEVCDKNTNKAKGLSISEWLLLQSFLCRAKLWQIKIALEWIIRNND